ncbi:tubulin-folding cofactor E [Pelomyxa schiedti]|nr:tubulin-folding cofactor E [Pelomyxa schiedti]
MAATALDCESCFDVGSCVFILEQEHVAVGCVRYVGTIEGKQGVWYGVEWDSPRGKHNGTVDGHSYFVCGEFHGSFVSKKSGSLQLAVSFDEAIRAKYSPTEIPSKRITFETVSAHEIPVEFVLSQNQLARTWQNLISLDLSASNIVEIPDVCSYSTKIPNLRSISLSNNALSRCDKALLLANIFPTLSELDLSHNFFPREAFPTWSVTVPQLRAVSLNYCRLTWLEVCWLLRSLPNVEELHLSHNNISSISMCACSSQCLTTSKLRQLSLDNNAIESWDEIWKLVAFPFLHTLFLSNNSISSVVWKGVVLLPQKPASAPFSHLEELSIAQNNITSWNSIDQLDLFPSLTRLRLTGNPVLQRHQHQTLTTAAARSLVIARLPKLNVLNGSQITVTEKSRAEVDARKLAIDFLHQEGALDLLSKTTTDKLPLPHIHTLALQQQQRSALPSMSTATTSSSAAASTTMTSSEYLDITLECNLPAASSPGSYHKKLPGSMLVRDVMALACKLFGLPLSGSSGLQLWYKETNKDGVCPQPLSELNGDLSCHGVFSGGCIMLESKT